MGIIRQFLRDYGYVHRSEIPRKSARAYAAASMGRLAGDWLSSSGTIDQEIKDATVAVRSRARDLSQNNEYAKAYLRCVRRNVVGSEGFQLQVRAMEYDPINKKMIPDSRANEILEDAFYQWGMPEFATVSGKLSFRKVQELVMESVARDGEMFVHIIRNRSNKFGFTLQLIEPDFIDHQMNNELKGGNIIRMGIGDAISTPIS